MKNRKFIFLSFIIVVHFSITSVAKSNTNIEKNDFYQVEYSIKATTIPKKYNKKSIDIECLNQSELNNLQSIDLINAIEKVICNSPETRSAWIQTKADADTLNIMKSTYYPKITSSLKYDLGKNKYQFNTQQNINNESDTSNYNISLQLNWLLYDFGSRYHQINEAKNLLAMSLALEDSILQSTILKTISSYYNIIQLEFQKDNIQKLVFASEKIYEIANTRYKIGVGNKSDQLQMYTNLIKAKSEYKLIDGKLKIAKGELAILMGESLNNFNTNTTLKNPEALNLGSIRELIEQAKETHPRFKALYFSISAGEEKIKHIKKSAYPSISLISDYFDSKQLSQGNNVIQTHQIQAGIQLNIPIFDGFSRKHQVAKAEKDLELKIIEREKFEEEISMLIWKNYNEIELTYENIKDLSALKESAEQAYDISQGRYKAGIGNIIEVIYAQNLLNEARMNYLTELKNLITLRYLLLYNIGKLR